MGRTIHNDTHNHVPFPFGKPIQDCQLLCGFIRCFWRKESIISDAEFAILSIFLIVVLKEAEVEDRSVLLGILVDH